MVIASKTLSLTVILVFCLPLLLAGCGELAKEPTETVAEPQEEPPARQPIRVEEAIEAEVEPVQPVETEVAPAQIPTVEMEAEEMVVTETEIEEQAPAVELAMKFIPDDTATYKVITEVERSVKMEGPSEQRPAAFKGGRTGSRVEMTFSQRIKKVDDKGNAIAEIKIQQLKYLATVTDKTILNFDSSRQGDSNNPLSKLIGLSYTIELTPQGDVSKIIDVNEVLSVVKGTSQDHMTGARLFAQSAIKQRHQIPVLVTAHEKQMRPGDSWSSVKTFSFGMMGSKSYERIYTLEEIKDMNGQQIAVVDMKAVPTSETAEQLHQEQATGFLTQMFDNNETYTGRLTLDLSEGKVEKCTEKLRTEWIAVDPAPEIDKEPSALRMTATRLYDIEKID